MTVIVEPSPQNTADPSAVAAAIHNAFGDYIADSDVSPHAQYDSRITGAPLNSFEYVGSSDVTGGVEITINTGEAFIGGHWVAVDEQLTTVINENEGPQRVYLGVDRSAGNSVILGKDADFPSGADPRISIYTFSTDASSVLTYSSERPIGPEQAQYDGVYSVSEVDDKFYTQDYIDNNFLTASGGGLESDLDFGQHQALNMLFHKSASEVSGAVEAQAWYRTDVDDPRIEVMTPRGIKMVPLEDLHYIIEDWEHNDETLWNIDGGGSFSITTDSFNGQYAAHVVDTKRVWNHPADDGTLDYYPQSGDYWEFYFKPNVMDGQIRHSFGRGSGAGFDSPPMYQIQTYGGGSFRLRERDNTGSSNMIAENYNVNYTLGNWYQVRHWWKHPEYSADHRLELYDVTDDTSVVTISGDNINLDKDTGGVMLYTNTGADVNWGDMHVVERTQ